MQQNTLGNARLRTAVNAALTGGSLVATFGVANAQTAPVAAPADNTLQEVVVTGSRLAVPNSASISPVTMVTSEDIQQTGVTRVEDLLNELPQVFAAQGSNIVNGSDGTAQANLRGLGAKRTLVLVNGDRLGPGDPTTGGASDLNEIPAELIDSVEVLTGGASSVYGADAVAGVVNFKLNDHFEGVKLVADGGIYNHTNTNTQGVETQLNAFNTATGNDFAPAPSSYTGGAQKSLAFIAGLNAPDGNGNATFYATYRNVAAVLQSKYSESACTFASGFLAGSYANGGKFQCSGSSTSFPGRFLQYNPAGTAVTSDTTIGPGGTLVPFTDANRYNYGPLNYYQRPDERYSTGAFLHYDFNEHATVYSNTMFMDDRTIAQIAPSGLFLGSQVNGNYIAPNCANPFLTASELQTWCGGSTAGSPANLLIGRRDVEGGNRQSDLEHTDFREVIGVKGKIDDAWNYDANFQYSLVNLNSTVQNYFSNTKLQNALDVVIGSNGQPQCVVGPPCVPYNIFTPGGVTQAALNYLYTPGELRGQITQTVVDANLTGDLGKYGVQLPTATSGLKVNLGAEWRDVKAFSDPDAEEQAADLSGAGGATVPVSGGIVSREAFIEARMPLIEGKPGAEELNFETGYRYSDYSTGFQTNTFKFGLDWKPIEEIRLRGSFSRAVRAPNIIELFAPQSVGLDGSVDPCAGSKNSAGLVNGYTAAQCARTGVSAAQFGNIAPNSAAQYNGLLGGNPNLTPETALTTSFGIGWTPAYIPNFRAQVDYYDIKIENVIGTIGANAILTQCLASNLFCNDIHRDALGSLWLSNQGYVVDALANIGGLEEKGIDLDLSYGFDIGAAGKVHLSYIGTYIDTFEVTANSFIPGTSYNCAGLFGATCSVAGSSANGPDFRYRSTMRATWLTPWHGADLTLSWRYFSPVKLESLSANPNLAASGGGTVANGGISNTDAYISSYSYFDLTGSVKIGDKLTFRVGVNNVLDKSAPVIGTTNLPGTVGNGNTFPQVYDALGRYIFASLIAQF